MTAVHIRLSWTDTIRGPQMSHVEIEGWRQRKAEIIERYGSADAATAPCEQEKLLLAAVAPWRATSEGWTVAVNGWRGDGSDYREMPARALQAIKDAYPLPTTFIEAQAEDAYWQTRNSELQDVLSEDGTFAEDVALDLIAEVRAAIVRDLALHELCVTNIEDLRDRLAMCRKAGVNDPRFEDAMFRDIAAMAEAAKAHPSTSKTDTVDQIKAALSADPLRSNRDIARSAGCSPTTVGRVRAAMGLQSNKRTVSRSGQRFEMHIDRHLVDQTPDGDRRITLDRSEPAWPAGPNTRSRTPAARRCDSA